jgi:hypothetical protein
LFFGFLVENKNDTNLKNLFWSFRRCRYFCRDFKNNHFPLKQFFSILMLFAMTLDLGFELLAQISAGETTELKSIGDDESEKEKTKKEKETISFNPSQLTVDLAANSTHLFRNSFNLQNDKVRSDCFASLPERPPKA